MDPVAIWTAIGVAVAAVVGVAAIVIQLLAAEVVRRGREIGALRAQLLDYLLRLTEADHARREAEQVAANVMAAEALRKGAKP